MPRFAYLTLLLVALSASASTAQDPMPLGSIGVFGDPNGTEGRVRVISLEPFHVYVVGRADPLGMKAWEGLVEFSPNVFLTDVELGDARAIDLGDYFPGFGKNFLVGIGECVVDPAPTMLARLTFLVIPNTYPWGDVCLGPADGGSVPGGLLPGYVNCLNEIHPFELAWTRGSPREGCAGLGDGICGEPLPTGTLVGLHDAYGPVGSTVAMPVTAHARGWLDCAVFEAELRSIRFELRWSGEVASLERVRMPDLPADWTGVITPIEGGALVELAGSTAIVYELSDGQPLAELDFLMLLAESETPVEISNVEVSGSSEIDLEADAGGGGQLRIATLGTEPPVATRAINFGALKAEYGRQD